jgi:hypothetical protein
MGYGFEGLKKRFSLMEKSSNTQGLRIRQSPRLDAAVLGSLILGEGVDDRTREKATIDGIEGRWLRVESEGRRCSRVSLWGMY